VDRPRDDRGQTTQDATSGVDSFLRDAARIPDAAPPAGDDLVGRSLGHFEIVERIGAGGMGVVYAARDLKLRRKVALKVLRAEVFAREARRRRFLREARAGSGRRARPASCTGTSNPRT
jgi:serine/threonine protein kinase